MSRHPLFRLAFVSLSILLVASGARALPTKWRELKPFFGGWVSRITVDTAGAVYVSTLGGVFRSADGGRSWTPANSGLSCVPGGALAADPVTAGKVYLAGHQGGLFRTENSGSTWTRLPLNLPGGVNVTEIAIAPSDPSRIFVSTWGDYVWRSLDGGATWERRSSGLSGGAGGPSRTTSIAVHPTNADRVYTSTWRGRLFRSDDAAGTWTRIADSRTWANGQIYIAPSSPNVLYTVDDGSTVFKSTDGGDTWSAVSRPTGGNFQQLAIDPADANVVYVGSSQGIHKSTDGGGSWTLLFAPSGTNTMLAVAIDPGTPAHLFGGATASGFYRSTDGGASWAQGNQGLGAITFSGLAIVRDAPSTAYMGVEGTGFLKSSDSGATWNVIGAAQGLPAHQIGGLGAHPADPNILAVYSYDGAVRRLWRSIDGGASFVGVATGHGSQHIRFNPHTPNVVNAATGDAQGGFLRSTDSGASWTIPFHLSLYGGGFDYHPTLPNVVFSHGAEYSGAGYTPLHLVWSNDGGGSWTTLNLGPSVGYTDLALDQNDPAVLYVTSGLPGEGTEGVYKFAVTYTGSNVTAVTRVPGTFNNGLTDTALNRLVYDKVNGALYAATFSGVFRSLDQAATWTHLPGLPYATAGAMAVHPDGSRLLVGTAGGLWELGPPDAPADFYTVTPCRLIDTRLADEPLLSGISRTFTVAGQCGISPSARAVMLNVTVVNPSGQGNVKLFPVGPVPLLSTIEFAAGRTRANNAIVSLAADGTLACHAVIGGIDGQIHVILDISGYFQ